MASYQDSQPFHWQYPESDDRNFQIHGRTLFFIVMLFSIILLVTLLLLYARWICRYHPSSAATISAASVAHAPPPQALGLDPVSINSLPLILYRPSDKELGECSICLGIFVDGDKVKVLPNCRHCYHSECVDKWLTNHSSCPLCRASPRVDSVV